jgi:hypothetical protein
VEEHKQQAEMDAAKSKWEIGFNSDLSAELQFSRKIKSVSNNAATISADKKIDDYFFSFK